jgi:hypothetical protein
MGEDVALRAVADALGLTGAGFGLPCLWGIWQLRATGQVATMLGFPTYRARAALLLGGWSGLR